MYISVVSLFFLIPLCYRLYAVAAPPSSRSGPSSLGMLVSLRDDVD